MSARRESSAAPDRAEAAAAPSSRRMRPVDEAVDLGHADESRRIAAGIDGARRDEVLQPPPVDEEQPVPAPHRRAGRVVVVGELAGHAVEHLDAPRAARQARPQQVGGQIRVESHQRRPGRRDQPSARPRRAIDRRDGARRFGRGGEEDDRAGRRRAPLASGRP